MRYFFLIYSLLLLLGILVLPNRFEKFSETEWRLFPDMDEQDKLLGQRPSNFFSDGRGARIPDKNIVPMGFAPLTEETKDTLADFSFTNGTSYLYTGKIDGADGKGFPEELNIKTLKDARQLLAHGKERYDINCSACHGVSGNGKGVVQSRSAIFAGIPDLVGGASALALPEGNIFGIITNGRNLMGSFKHNTTIKDRWAIIAYLRSLQEAKKAAK